MDKLPQPEGHMQIAEALFLEVHHVLIDEGIETESKAIERYQKYKSMNKSWDA